MGRADDAAGDGRRVGGDLASSRTLTASLPFWSPGNAATVAPDADMDIWALPLDGEGEPFAVVSTPFEERDAVLAGRAVDRLPVERLRAPGSVRPAVPRG
jgi:hypothetical protein